MGFKSGNGSIIDVIIEGAELHEEAMQGRKELDTNALLVLRTFVNIFESDNGKALMMKEYEKVALPGKAHVRFSRHRRLGLPGRVVKLLKLLSVLFSSSTFR